MNVALIFAGGSGTRMNTKSKPKQFLELHGKEIIIYTLEHFERHPEIDAIAVVCIADWIDYLKSIIRKHGIDKVKWIVPGGETGQDSIFNGLEAIHKDCPEDSVVLIHDGVRPLINRELISDNIVTNNIVGERYLNLRWKNLYIDPAPSKVATSIISPGIFEIAARNNIIL